jgi:FkbH-like protein
MKKLALLSNVNIDPLKNHLEKNNELSVYCAGFNQWQSELLNPLSGLYTFCPDFIFIYLNADEFAQNTDELPAAVDAFSAHFKLTQFVIADFMPQPFSVETYTNDINLLTNKMNAELKMYASEKKNVHIFEMNRLISYHGYNALFDDKYWYLGSIKFSHTGFKTIANEINYQLNSIQGKTKKVLVLDVDNTIWGGVAAEDGWENIQIGHQGTGRIYSDFQKNIIKLKNQGVLLAICSKNDENDVREVFEKNKNMLLRWDDFVGHYINWQPKADNILHMATDLKLGVDSFVFIDDHPVEREHARNEIPELTVPEFPRDITQLNRWLITDVVYPFFAKSAITAEDLEKTNQYQRNAERQNVSQHLSYDEFIKKLNIRLKVKKVNTESYKRIAQLTQKTNQFNLSLKRYTDIEMLNLMENTDYLALSCEYEDKFGNEGIIGCAIIKMNGESAFLESYMLSCRVLGRRVEHFFMNFIENKLIKLNVNELNTVYKPTQRNAMLKTFLSDYGFTTNDELYYSKKLTKTNR